MMSRKTIKAIVIIIVIAMVVTSFSFVLFLPAAFGAEEAGDYTRPALQELYAQITPQEQRYLSEQLRELERYLKYIQENFKDDVDFKTLLDGAFEGAMNSLDDPYSVFFTDAGEGQSFLDNVMGEYGGIGVTMTMNMDNLCEITEVAAGGPASRAGVMPGDIVFKIDGQDVTEKSLYEISSMLRGEEGANVALTVKRGGSEFTFALTREIIATTSVEYEMLENNIGYILLKSFDANGAKDFRDAKASLIKSGAESLILDIRDNAGGLINTALDIVDEFITSGDILHLKQKVEIIETISAMGLTNQQIRTVLLVNGGSASAAEILAGALQDHKAATLVGTPTYGKGAAQIMAYTNERQPYKLSVYYFLTPNKNDIHDVGIMPDYIVRNSLGGYRQEAMELYETFAPFVENTKPKAGDIGLNVFAAQQRLSLLGYSPGMTAVMDSPTVEAIKLFQQEQGLYAYGELDFTTMRKIQEATISYINNDSAEDLQLIKAIELLKQ